MVPGIEGDPLTVCCVPSSPVFYCFITDFTYGDQMHHTYLFNGIGGVAPLIVSFHPSLGSHLGGLGRVQGILLKSAYIHPIVISDLFKDFGAGSHVIGPQGVSIQAGTIDTETN